jgi:MioC protein
MKINILVGTMTGTAQMCAQEIELALDGDDVQVATLLMDKLEPSVFDDREAVYLVCTSTYGQGDVPDNAKALYEALCSGKPACATACSASATAPMRRPTTWAASASTTS